MLPDDWADGSLGPRRFDLSSEWGELEGRYSGLGPDNALEANFGLVRDEGATVALLEREYIDADYRDEFANFYATTFRALPDRCERLHFWRESTYLGFLVVRPIKSRPVCRTVLASPDDLTGYISCLPEAVARPYAGRLSVQGFPFISQDFQYGVCAHAAIWMIAMYHHLALQSPRRFISDIVKAAGTRAEVGRLVPSAGLSVEQVGTALRELGLPVLVYDPDDLPTQQTPEKVVMRYLDSHLPVALVWKDHMTVLIGYGRRKDDSLFFVHADDNYCAYRKISVGTDADLGDWKALLIPLPGRIYLSGESAEVVARRVFDLYSATEAMKQLFAQWDRGDTRLRSYVVKAGEYKLRLRARGLPDEVIASHALVSTSNWIWVVEQQHTESAKNGRRCVIGEIAVDATSDRLDVNPLFANMPGTCLTWYSPDENPIRRATSQAALYETGTALHDDPRAE